MKKNFKINVDCANCANKIENEVSKMEGIKSSKVNFMFEKMSIEFEDGVNVEEKMKEIVDKCKKIEPDFEILS